MQTDAADLMGQLLAELRRDAPSIYLAFVDHAQGLLSDAPIDPQEAQRLIAALAESRPRLQ